MPIEFLESLPLSESEKELFVQSLQSPVPVSIRVNPKKIVDLVEEYTSDDIWIGCMSGLNINSEIDDEHKKELEKLYGKKSLTNIMASLKDNKKVFWKTSVMKIILRKK